MHHMAVIHHGDGDVLTEIPRSYFLILAGEWAEADLAAEGSEGDLAEDIQVAEDSVEDLVASAAAGRAAEDLEENGKVI